MLPVSLMLTRPNAGPTTDRRNSHVLASLPETRADVYDRVSAAVVRIILPEDKENGRRATGGTGFFFRETGLIATCLHVVMNSKFKGKIVIESPAFTGTRYANIMASSDERGDFAVLGLVKQKKDADLKVPVIPLIFATQPLQTGYIFAATQSAPRATQGVLVQGYQLDTSPLVDFDGYSAPGYSGGPVVDQVGRCFAILKGASLSGIGVSQVIPLPFVAHILAAFTAPSPGPVEHAPFAVRSDASLHGRAHPRSTFKPFSHDQLLQEELDAVPLPHED
jgi:S1-C subfamily serine protease